ncbi:MAG: hypothetical protein QF921_03975 [Pseudomonadales bacterium]|jgi:hypothetical protein|nr:hypothetical protein [Pseudomonadales bacterium]MDP6471835.1 hypothetical protein [Pseudomonadales bacterium]MDP6828751.1 hypothetical protein [Pseudomonadales bacterium]MDP6970661.1 hypothetical protein [Pseudomonadales bacterium]
MRFTSLIFPIAAVTALFAGSVLALPEFPIDITQADQRAQQRFETADTDSDGLISLEEFTALAPNRAPHRGFKYRDRGEHHGTPLGRDQRGVRRHGAPRAPHDGPHMDEETRAVFEEKLFALLDIDGNGELSREEASRKARKLAHRQLRAEMAFQRLDTDDSGSIEPGELPNRVEHLRELDSDGDGLVSREEIHSARRGGCRE